MKNSTALGAAVVGTALALLASPASAAKASAQYTSPELTCVYHDRTDYAPHAYAVCSTSSVEYTVVNRQGKVAVSGTGTTDYTFQAGVYHNDHSFQYSFNFVTKPGQRQPYHVQESSTYSPATGITCTYTIDFAFVKGVLTQESAINVCP